MATAYKDYYGILGVDRSASQKEIKAAFRKRARRTHPDLNQGDPGAEAAFKELNEANEVLSDPEKRARYDEYGPRWEQQQAWERAGRPGPGPFGGADFGGGGPAQYRTMSAQDLEQMFGDSAPFSDFFQQMFGGATASGSRPAMVRTGDDVEGEVSISLEEVATGAALTFEMQDAGRVRRVEVSVPKGIRDGARVRVRGQGGKGSGGGAAGNLYVRVHVRPHPGFAREGDDLRTTVPVPLRTALLGGTVEVPTIEGRRVQLTVPESTQNGQVLRLRGLGIPHLRGGGRGDLMAVVDVRLPVPMAAETRAWAEAMPAADEHV